MAKTKTASVRLPKEMYEEIDNICDAVNCSRNDWIKDTLQDKLREENNENTQDQEVIKDIKPQEIPKPKIELIDDEPKEEPKATIELIPEPKITIKEVPQDNSNKPQVDMVLFNGKYIPKAEVYEI